MTKKRKNHGNKINKNNLGYLTFALGCVMYCQDSCLIAGSKAMDTNRMMGSRQKNYSAFIVLSCALTKGERERERGVKKKAHRHTETDTQTQRREKKENKTRQEKKGWVGTFNVTIDFL